MKTRMAVVAVLTVAAGVFVYTRPHNHIPTDLRDAPADTWSDGTAMGQLDAKHAASDINVPEPKAAEAAGSGEKGFFQSWPKDKVFTYVSRRYENTGEAEKSREGFLSRLKEVKAEIVNAPAVVKDKSGHYYKVSFLSKEMRCVCYNSKETFTSEYNALSAMMEKGNSLTDDKAIIAATDVIPTGEKSFSYRIVYFEKAFFKPWF
ncbi:MAG: hypothetical protein M0011_00200 [Elusimicrobia bacterium]|nr:hypothetical protein [Elusimicrobiota bacterium]